MKFRKILALLLSVMMITAILAGCKQQTKSPFVSPDNSAAPNASESAPPVAALNFDGAYAANAPETVMLTVDEKNITWDELYYYIYNLILEMQSQGVSITDWSADYADGITYKDYILDNAINYILNNAAVAYGARLTGTSISEEDRNEIQAEWDTQAESAGGEEALIAQFEAEYGSKELFMKIQEMSYLAEACFTEMYGENGGKLTDEEVADNTAEDGYLMAKHILFKTKVTDASGAETAMTDTEKAAVREKAEELLSQLQDYDGEDFESYFDELMNANSEDDGGLASFPQGYLFQNGDMVTPFYDATIALEIGQFSGLVETDFGYHIVYRIPVNYDMTPMLYLNYGAYSLRYITAVNMFRAVVDTWLNSLNVVYSDAYEALDFNKIFAVG